MPTKRGAIRLFRLAGITVYLHWAWFLAFLFFTSQPRDYSSYGWNALEVLALFLIVLTHEFGHQLACRQVGGQTHDIILFPFGGVAYVSPPERPGAQLWSIAAGPLVNVALIPILSGLVSLSWHLGWADTCPNLYELIHAVWQINVVLLIFNMLPVYPLDGGQILRSLLWFPFGRANSLMVASIIGFIGVAGMFVLAGWLFVSSQNTTNSIWMAAISAFILMNCWRGFKYAKVLGRLAKLPRRPGFACPSCKTAPPLGQLWRCGKCGQAFDTFLTQGTCPHCGTQFNVTQCLDCGTSSPLTAWTLTPPGNN
jgi:Zn-dependent protease